MKKASKLFILVMVFTIVLSSLSINKASANTTVYLNEKATVPISISLGKPGAGFYELSTGQRGAVGDPLNGVYVNTFKTNAVFTPTSLGSYKITLSLDVSDSNANQIKVSPKTVTVNVVKRSSTPPPKPPQIDDTEREKREAEKKLKEELAKRMKTPLITDIEIISNSDRLSGEKVGEIKPESEKFAYETTLPRNIDNIKLKVSTIKDDVEIKYDENLVFKPGEDSLEFVIKATQDRLEQEFKIKLNKPEKSTFLPSKDGKTYELIVDSLLDKSMEDLGFDKILMNEEDPSAGFYYSLDSNNYILAIDKENKGYVFLIDEKNNIVKEVLLVSNPKNKASILVNEVLPEDDSRLLNSNEYIEHEVEISKLITDLDKSIEFNNKINGWLYEEALITHGLDSEGKADLVHLDSQNNMKFAFIEFDQPLDKSSKLISYGGYGLWALTLIIFIVYVVKTKKDRGASYSKH